jgi:hypothetical protein
MADVTVPLELDTYTDGSIENFLITASTPFKLKPKQLCTLTIGYGDFVGSPTGSDVAFTLQQSVTANGTKFVGAVSVAGLSSNVFTIAEVIANAGFISLDLQGSNAAKTLNTNVCVMRNAGWTYTPVAVLVIPDSISLTSRPGTKRGHFTTG